MFEKLTISTEDSEVFFATTVTSDSRGYKTADKSNSGEHQIKKRMLQHNCTDFSSQ